jgi:hypothetical protein
VLEEWLSLQVWKIQSEPGKQDRFWIGWGSNQGSSLVMSMIKVEEAAGAANYS